MDKTTFEALRDLPGKRILGDIRPVRQRQLAPLLVAEGIKIENSEGIELVLTIQYNPVVGSKTMNVHVPGVGPICRLDVDGPSHQPHGRSHKHALQSARCPDRNLPDGIVARNDLAGKALQEVFSDFCRMANITHTGQLELPAVGK